jgi:hypothetical protein
MPIVTGTVIKKLILSLQVGENSDKDTVIGSLLVDDPDNHVEVTQTFSFVVINSAGGRFKVEDGQIKVCQFLTIFSFDSHFFHSADITTSMV